MATPIPKAFINDLLNQCDIVALINHFIPLRKRSNNYVACCPFHEEGTPSFTVSPTKQLYHCFGCGAGGNAISFIIAYEKLDFISAVEWLANHFQIKIPSKSSTHTESTNKIEALYTALEDSISFYQTQLSKTPSALNYLKKRGVTESTIQKFKLGFAPESWNNLLQFLTQQKNHSFLTLKTAGLIIQKNSSHYYDRFRSRIIFPIRDKQGRYIGLGGRVLHAEHEPKYLNSPETPIFHKNQALYGLYESCEAKKKMQRIWVVEGYLDVIMLHQFGITEAMATLGTATSRTHLQQLFRLTEEVVFCFDGDLAGKKAAIRALELSLSSLQDSWNLRFLLLPLGEDPDSWIRQSTSTAWENLITTALSLEGFLFKYLQNGIALQTHEGQRALLQKAIPLLKKIPPGIRQEQLFQRLSRLVNIEIETLKRLPIQTYRLPQAQSSHKNGTYTVLDRAIGLLLQHPQILAPYLSTILNDSLQAVYPVLSQLIDRIQKKPHTHTAALLEDFRNDPSITEYFIALAQYDWLIPADGVIAEFQDILIHLNKSIRNQKIKHLLQKAHQGSLNTVEKNQLTRLLGERK